MPPIKPQDIKRDPKARRIPEAVFVAFNELLVEKWDGREARITLIEALKLAVEKMNRYFADSAGEPQIVSEAVLMNNRWMDVEDDYRKAGWSVVYEQPIRGEDDFGAYYVFTKSTRG